MVKLLFASSSPQNNWMVDSLKEEFEVTVSNDPYLVTKWKEVSPDVFFLYGNVEECVQGIKIIQNHIMLTKIILFIELTHKATYTVLLYLMDLADQVLVCSTYWKAYLESLQFPKDKIKVIVPFNSQTLETSLEPKYPLSETNDFVIVHTGGDLYLDAFINFLKTWNFDPRIKLYFTSLIEDDLIREAVANIKLKYKISDKNLDHHIIFHPPNKKELIYNASDVVLHWDFKKPWDSDLIKIYSFNKYLIIGCPWYKDVLVSPQVLYIEPVSYFSFSDQGEIGILNPKDIEVALNNIFLQKNYPLIRPPSLKNLYTPSFLTNIISEIRSQKNQYFLVYNDNTHAEYLQQLIRSVKQYGPQFKVIEFYRDQIDNVFFKNHLTIFYHQRGGGYWLWKPYIINTILEKMVEGEILFYLDSKYYFKEDFKNLYTDFMKENDFLIWKNKPNCIVWYMINWCKMDVVKKFNMERKIFVENAEDCWAGAMVIKKNQRTVSLIKKWLDICCVPENITDSKSEQSNHPFFVEHRHDQSLLSIILHQASIPFQSFPRKYLQNIRSPY